MCLTGRKEGCGIGREVADQAEVLDFFTRVMRGDLGDEKVSERTKAAELLGKHCGLFGEQEAGEERNAETAGIIERLLEGMRPDP